MPACGDLLNPGGQPRRNDSGGSVAEGRVDLLPGVLAHRQLEMPAFVGAADSPPP